METRANEVLLPKIPKKRKYFKGFFINLNSALVETSSDCFLADECAIKNSNR